MKPKEILSNTMENKTSHQDTGNGSPKIDSFTPMKKDAFEKSDNRKISEISKYFRKIMETMGLDMSDESLQDTPDRVAKMYIQEIFHGLKPENEPEVTLFENKFGYDQMLIQKNISVYSFCEHHFLPIVGNAHVAYFPEKKIAGLSKLNRIVDYFARRPQVQERLTRQIALKLQEALQTQHIAVVIDAQHMCVSARGIKDTESQTISSQFLGKFEEAEVRKELLSCLKFNDTVLR